MLDMNAYNSSDTDMAPVGTHPGFLQALIDLGDQQYQPGDPFKRQIIWEFNTTEGLAGEILNVTRDARGGMAKLLVPLIGQAAFDTLATPSQLLGIAATITVVPKPNGKTKIAALTPLEQAPVIEGAVAPWYFSLSEPTPAMKDLYMSGVISDGRKRMIERPDNAMWCAFAAAVGLPQVTVQAQGAPAGVGFAPQGQAQVAHAPAPAPVQPAVPPAQPQQPPVAPPVQQPPVAPPVAQPAATEAVQVAEQVAQAMAPDAAVTFENAQQFDQNP